MSGCYQCGHITGSESELCECCYQRRFHQVPKEQQVLELPAEGIELSDGARKVALTSGAFIYIIVIVVVVMSVPYIEKYRRVMQERSSTDPRYDFVMMEEGAGPSEDEERAAVTVRTLHTLDESAPTSPISYSE